MDMLAGLFFRGKYPVKRETDYALGRIFIEPDRDKPRGSHNNGCFCNMPAADKEIYVLARFIF